MKSITLLATAVVAATSTVADLSMGLLGPRIISRAAVGTAPTEPQPAPEPAQLNVITYAGCFSSPGELKFNTTIKFNSLGKCAQETCLAGDFTVAASTGGNICYCGTKLPPKSTQVKETFCNLKCPGIDKEACGGATTDGQYYYTLYNTGKTIMLVNSADDTTNSGSTGTTTGPGTTGTGKPTASTTSQGNSAVTVTATNSATPSGGSNTVAIAVGVVVSVVVLAAAAIGIFLFLRRRRNKEIEEEHRRNAAVSAFSPSTGGTSISDARLDPVMAQRRMSDGSIADNHDYSRKILRVCFVSPSSPHCPY
ncbi:hypothetical protein B0H63DRAFT_181938 [Podospora didyma]|uniref:WSC domain-containing protein n=1 Tax=Podospora didyma TaxID=330526 RepID=A0AAE0NPN5_9PEZI|nr:hypothetical protein B0H63DRAFT_181938 [Podospora didyma]